MRMRHPSQIRAPRIRFHPGFLLTSNAQVPHSVTNHWHPHYPSLITDKLCQATMFLQLSCCSSVGPGAPGVCLTGVTSLLTPADSTGFSKLHWRGWDARVTSLVWDCPSSPMNSPQFPPRKVKQTGCSCLGDLNKGCSSSDPAPQPRPCRNQLLSIPGWGEGNRKHPSNKVPTAETKNHRNWKPSSHTGGAH